MFAQFTETLLEAGELQGIDLSAGHVAPAVVGVTGQCGRVVQQQLGFLFYRQILEGHRLARYLKG
ncbi:hypothetical protein D3C80_2171000 [compost metagenome]